ncbi:MAG TPA: MFS transporter, partial [Anaerolineae bacterium]
WVMVVSLATNALCYLLMSQASTFGQFAVLMTLNGAVNPLYRVGTDAMMADLIRPEKRLDAYALLRLSNNIGVAVGPAVGGLLAATSYHLALYGGATGLAIYSVLITLFAVETLPGRGLRRAAEDDGPAPRAAWRGRGGERFGGYGSILTDRPYMAFVVAFILTQACTALIWVLMAVYAKRNYGVPESQYGLIATTNALMVVFFQLAVTRVTRRFPPLRVLALGAAIYAAAVAGVALATGFWGFWAVMIVMTVGELILAPTSSTYAANRAPADKRGRYMSIYGLTWGIAAGLAPVAGGALNDNLGPRSTWFGGGLVGLTGVILFLFQSARSQAAPAASGPTSKAALPGSDT